MSKNDRRTLQQEISPWRTSRAKKYFEQRLLDDDDSIHNKTDEHIFETSVYSDGEPVVKTKNHLNNFKANYKRLKATQTRNKSAAAHGSAALELERKLYPRPALNFTEIATMQVL